MHCPSWLTVRSSLMAVSKRLVYHEGIDLPHFAAFVLFDRPEGAPILAQYFARYAEIGRANNVGVVLESATWRANPDWGHKLGYNDNALADVQRKSIEQLLAIRERYATPGTPIVVSGNFGPRAAMVIDPTHG